MYDKLYNPIKCKHCTHKYCIKYYASTTLHYIT